MDSLKNVYGIDTIPTFEVTQAQIDAIDHAAAGRRLANSIHEQAGMDEAYGAFNNAHQMLVDQIFSGDKLDDVAYINDWVNNESCGWDELGSWADILHQLAWHIAFLIVVVDSED